VIANNLLLLKVVDIKSVSVFRLSERKIRNGELAGLP
jgi:hypothetical protein